MYETQIIIVNLINSSWLWAPVTNVERPLLPLDTNDLCLRAHYLRWAPITAVLSVNYFRWPPIAFVGRQLLPLGANYFRWTPITPLGTNYFCWAPIVSVGRQLLPLGAFFSIERQLQMYDYSSECLKSSMDVWHQLRILGAN